MKALSIKQPWAWLVFNEGKDIENRRWSTNYRGPLLIHAGKYSDVPKMRNFINRPEVYREMEEQRGGIVGIVDLVDVLKPMPPSFEEPYSKWRESYCYGFVFANARKLPFVPMRGELRIFNVDDGLVKL